MNSSNRLQEAKLLLVYLNVISIVCFIDNLFFSIVNCQFSKIEFRLNLHFFLPVLQPKQIPESTT